MKPKGLFFSSGTSFSVIATFFALWLAVYFDGITEDYFGYILIITIGILHGANDIKLLDHVIRSKNDGRIWSLWPYIGLVLITGIAFYFIPAMALLIFVLLSCYHFGEQHWVDKSVIKGALHKVFYLFYGMVIFGFLFYLNAIETISIIKNITAIELNSNTIGMIGLISLILTLGIGIYLFSQKFIRTNWIEELFLLVVFAIVFKIASLIWAFAIYFILWHSLPSLNDQIKLLYGKSSTSNIKRYLKSSWLYYTLAIIGLGLTLYLLRDQEQLFLSLFFSFLAAITLPHVLVMMRLFKS